MRGVYGIERKRFSRAKLRDGVRRFAAALAAVSSLTCALAVPGCGQTAQAAGKRITMSTCRNLAIAASSSYEDAEMAVQSKQAAYESAVKAIALKQEDMSTFRWSPLLSFKFPEEPNFAQSSEFRFKPVKISYEIKVAQHKLQDKVFEISEQINNLYVEIVVLQNTIAFNEKRAAAYQSGLARNQAKLKLGEARQADIDALQKKLETINNKVASDKRTLEADLKKLGNKINLDVTTGYTFERPFVEATISRDKLPALIQYTEDRDETYYEACINETTERTQLTTNYNLMRGKYARDIGMISGYVDQALRGNSVPKKAFKDSYKRFLERIDSYWEGRKYIFLFISIPRLWLKGDLDGTRYIDDDPYTLYQNALDYVASSNEKKTAKQDLDQSVEDTFNNYVSVRNSYQQYVKDVDKAGRELEASEKLNRMGQLSFEEYDAQLSSYEDLQNSMMDALKLYTTTLYNFDRLTCGGVSALLSGTDADMKSAVVGESFPEKETSDGAHYYLQSIIQNQEFELSVHIPDGFDVPVSDFELWVDNFQVGARTPVTGKLRHLALTKDNVQEAKIRLYNGADFVDDCVIDPATASGPLKITKGYTIKKNEGDELGTYELAQLDSIGMVELKVKPTDEKVKKFRVTDPDGKYLGGDALVDITKGIRYLPLLSTSLGDLTVELADQSGSVLYRARIDEQNAKLRKRAEGG